MVKKLLILGGSRINIEIVEKAKNMGIYTIVTDWYDVSKSPAKLIADEYYNISTTDYEEIEKLVKEQLIDGVITGYTDSTLLPYAKICDNLNLPCYGTNELFELFTDKSKYKAKLKKYNIPVIEEVKYEEFDSLVADEFPLLIKPVDGSGSKGINICHNREDFFELYAESKKSSQSKKVLVEKYIEGKELTAFFVFINGEIYLSSIGDRIMSKPSEKEKLPLPVGYLFPSIQTEKFEKDLLPQLKKMFKDVSVQNGMMFMQCLVSNGKIHVYDIGYRLTGSLEYKIQNQLQGFDPLEMLINHALTGEMVSDQLRLPIESYSKKIGFNISVLGRVNLVLKEVVGIELLKSHPNIIDVVVAKDLNKEIPANIEGTLAQITVRVLGFAKNSKELRDVIGFIKENLYLKDDQGNDMTQSILTLEHIEEEIENLEKIYG